MPQGYLTQQRGSCGIYTPTSVHHWLRVAVRGLPILQFFWFAGQAGSLLHLQKKKFPDANKILGVGSHPEHPVMVVCQA